MPRNGAGNFTLAAGNPVVSGTEIQSTWANATLADVADALTNSLARNGEGGMTAPLRLVDGVETTPSLAFANETSTGVYRAASGDVGVSVLGSRVVRVRTSGVDVTGAASVSGNVAVNTNKFTVEAATGNTAVAGNVAVNTDKFTVEASSGNTAIAGSLAVTGETKVTALKHPSSATNNIVLGADGSVNISGSNYSPQTGFKNRIINGAMTIDQRYAGASVTLPSGGTYTLDRWTGFAGQSSKLSVQQNAGAVTPPAGFSNYLGVTSLSAYSILTSDIFNLNQKIEGFNVSDLAWGTANAAPITLSFLVRSSLTGTFGGSLLNGAGNRSYPFSYSIPVANTWTTVSVTIAGDTSGTWLTTNGIGIYVSFGLGTGATYSGTAGAWTGSGFYSATGSVSVVGTSGATFYITGVQLEKGSVATPYEFRSIGTELGLCERYFQNEYNFYQGAFGNPSTGSYTTRPLPTQMRAAPTITFTAAAGTWTGTNAFTGGSNGVGADKKEIKFAFISDGSGTAVATNISLSAEL